MRVSLAQICDWKGVTKLTVQNWRKEGMPVIDGGGRGKAAVFESAEIDNWLIEREIKKRVVNSSGEAYDRAEEEARLKHHQANNEELKEMEKRGELLPTTLVIELCSTGVTNCRNRLLSVDKKLRNEFLGVDEEVFERVHELHVDALTQLGTSGIPRGLEKRISQNLE